jgi:5-methylcytosine-specific restriction endonuclease McrA
VCLNLQPCADHPPRPAWDHGGRSRQARGLDAEYDRNRAIVLREETHCGICGEPGLEDDTADHKVPRAQGGGNERSNLQRAHRECNQRKGGAARC